MNTLVVRLDPLGMLSNGLEGFVDNIVGDLGRLLEMFVVIDPTVPLTTRGRCINLPDRTRISIFMGNVTLDGDPIGGATTRASSMLHACYLLMVHELRHAWQYSRYGHSTWDDSKQWHEQPHEIDAMWFVDQQSRFIYDHVRSLSSLVASPGLIEANPWTSPPA